MKIQARSTISRCPATGRGFTLIELLVAMAITTVIIAILVSITSLSLDTWNRSRSEIRAARQGKSMIDSMARDFESLVIRKGNNFQWLYANSNPSSDGPRGNASPNAVDLIFFSAATDRYDGQIGVTGTDLGGDVSTIGYRLTYKDPIDASATDDFKTFVLYRKIVDPKDTFDNLLGQTDLEASFTTLTGTGNNAVDNERNFICENVYQFTVTFHVDVTIPSGTSETTVSVPVAIGKGSKQASELKITGSSFVTTPAFSGSSVVTGSQLQTGRVSSVEISLTVLTDFGLQQLRKRANLTGTAKNEFIAKNSYQYSKLIPISGS